MSKEDHAYHAPERGNAEHAADMENMKALRKRLIALDRFMDKVCPGGRDLAIAKTYLEEVRMWAIGSIAKKWPMVEE